VTYAPSSGFTDLSYSIEDWHSDLVLSEVFSGCKINRLSFNVPPQGMSTVGFDFLGKDITAAGAEYFTSPTAETTTGIAAAANGIMVAQGAAIATLTGLQITLDGNMTAEDVIGSTTYQDIAEGRILVSGTATGLFDSATLRDYFLNETEVSLVAFLPVSSAAAADFVASRCRASSSATRARTTATSRSSARCPSRRSTTRRRRRRELGADHHLLPGQPGMSGPDERAHRPRGARRRAPRRGGPAARAQAPGERRRAAGLGAARARLRLRRATSRCSTSTSAGASSACRAGRRRRSRSSTPRRSSSRRRSSPAGRTLRPRRRAAALLGRQRRAAPAPLRLDPAAGRAVRRRPRKFFAGVHEQLIAYARHQRRLAEPQDDGGSLGQHLQAAARAATRAPGRSSRAPSCRRPVRTSGRGSSS
jgi:hypothetical protein